MTTQKTLLMTCEDCEDGSCICGNPEACMWCDGSNECPTCHGTTRGQTDRPLRNPYAKAPGRPRTEPCDWCSVCDRRLPRPSEIKTKEEYEKTGGDRWQKAEWCPGCRRPFSIRQNRPFAVSFSMIFVEDREHAA
jgi:hypothetical protein